METTAENTQINNDRQLALRWVIRDVTDPDDIKEALEYKPGHGWFRNRLECMEVSSVIVIENVPVDEVRPRVYGVNGKDGKHFTVVPPTDSFPNVRVYRDK
jgi:hypothetical protein